jgi:phosphate transport system permease protein
MSHNMAWRGLWPWLCAASVALSLLLLGLLLALLLSRGLGHFWPAPLEAVTLTSGETFAGEAIREAKLPDQPGHERLYFIGNRDSSEHDPHGARFRWINLETIAQRDTSARLVRLSRSPWGDFIGRLEALEQGGQRLEGDAAWQALSQALAQPENTRPDAQLMLQPLNGDAFMQPLEEVYRASRPNAMTWLAKVRYWGTGVGQFLSQGPRAANTGGGVWPAIFGTVVMVIVMSVIVMPFGVLAAIYLNEIAEQNRFTRLVRIGVRNLAGVPSIVYGVFGLGAFVYGIGSTLDEWFFSARLP